MITDRKKITIQKVVSREGTEQLRKIDKMDVRTGLYHSFETTVVKPFLSFIEFLGAKALASASNVCKG